MADDTPAMGVLKHGIGYDLVFVEERARHVGLDPVPMILMLGIRCHACQRVSFHPKDIQERYCGACQRFHVTRTVEVELPNEMRDIAAFLANDPKRKR